MNLLAVENISRQSSGAFEREIQTILDQYGKEAEFGFPAITPVEIPRITLNMWHCFAGAVVVSGVLHAFHDFDIDTRKNLSLLDPDQIALGVCDNHSQLQINHLEAQFPDELITKQIKRPWFEDSDHLNMIVYPNGIIHYAFGNYLIEERS